MLALTLEQLHEQIAILHGGAEVAKVIRNYNCRTHAVRMIYVEQTRAYDCVADYIRTLVALLVANDREAVVAKITEHFEAKVDQVHTLVKEVTAQAFSRECGDNRLETITRLAKPVLGSALLSTAKWRRCRLEWIHDCRHGSCVPPVARAAVAVFNIMPADAGRIASAEATAPNMHAG